MTFGVGARWSKDLKPDAGTETCELPHVALVLSGTPHVVMTEMIRHGAEIALLRDLCRARGIADS